MAEKILIDNESWVAPVKVPQVAAEANKVDGQLQAVSQSNAKEA